jgi:hypothetical protein
MFGNPNKALEFSLKMSYNSIRRSDYKCVLVRFSERAPVFESFWGDQEMDVTKMLAELRQEREQIEEAILSLERLARGRGKRRGRPPAWMSEIKRRGRPPGSKNKPKADSKSMSAKAQAVA